MKKENKEKASMELAVRSLYLTILASAKGFSVDENIDEAELMVRLICTLIASEAVEIKDKQKRDAYILQFLKISMKSVDMLMNEKGEE